MINKYLLLRFEDAKLFNTHAYTKDKIHNVFDSKMRDRFFNEPITRFQISNLLHVLFNERPVNSRRYNYYEKVDYYYEKALNSHLKYDEGYYMKDEKGDFIRNHREVRSLNSAHYNSWNPNVYLNWEMVKVYLGKENNDWFFESLRNILNIEPLDVPFSKIILMVNKIMEDNELLIKDKKKNRIFGADKEKPEILFFQELYNRKLAGFIYVFSDFKYSTLTSSKETINITINSYVDRCDVYCGHILVPVTEDDIEHLKTKSKGVATLLDGGFVWIENLINSRYVSLDGYTPVKDISIEETIIKKK